MKKRSDGRYQKRITLPNGKSKLLYSSANSEREAIKDFNRQMLTLEAEHEKSLNFDSVATEWASHHFPTLQNNSLKLYRPCTKAAIEYFGDTPMAEITSEDVSLYLDHLSKLGYSKKTIKERYAVLKQIFIFALAKKNLKHNPCALVKLKSSKYATTPKREQATPDEEQLIKNLTDDVPFGFFAKFLLYTGCRRGEALALTPKDIDINNRVIKINKTVEWVGNVPYIKDTPKTEAGIREIPIPSILVDELKGKLKQNYIFENEKHQPMHNAQVTRRWNALKKETGITCTPHQLRHSYTTMLFDAGIDVKTAQRWLGHNDIKTTLDIYTHLSERRQESSVKKWFDFVENT